MSGVVCFFLMPVDGRVRVWLRRYGSSGCPGPYGYHNGLTLLGANLPEAEVPNIDAIAPDDPRWPRKCDHCDQVFADEQRQVHHMHLFRRADTNEELTLREAAPGAMWDATWFHDAPEYCGPDGRCLIVRCPDGHDWMIDSRCSNCTLPNDKVHKCWVRHGEPPRLTVDKNGVTCSAGAGSIQTPKWHGFLRDGVLVS